MLANTYFSLNFLKLRGFLFLIIRAWISAIYSINAIMIINANKKWISSQNATLL